MCLPLIVRPSRTRSTEGFFLSTKKKTHSIGSPKGYDQIAIIDADIYIRPEAPNIFDDLSDKYDFGAVVERDMPISGQYAMKIKNYSNMQYTPLQ